jgi:hypothetical protein
MPARRTRRLMFEAGMALRDDPRLRFGGFDNLIALAQSPMGAASTVRDRGTSPSPAL